MNDSFKEVKLHEMTDGGLLLSIDGSSYTTYMKEEVSSYRVIINNQTMVFEKENDPTILRSPSAGKLLKLLKCDGDHVCKGEVYAEIVVMKMVMTLSSEQDGLVHFDCGPGAVLEAGTIIGHITLDDSSLVTTAQTYHLQFPLCAQSDLNAKLSRTYQRYICETFFHKNNFID